jgi:small subunit ribosomal protein S11
MANEEEVKGTEAPVEKPVETAEQAPANTSDEASAESPVEAKEEQASVNRQAEEPAESKAESNAAEKPAGAKAEKAASGEDSAAASDTVSRKVRTKSGKHIPVGIVHVKATFNNTQVTITDPNGAVVSWSNAGRCGFKGSRKSTAYAATTVAQEAARQAHSHGMHEVEVQVQGPGAGRESAVRAVQAAGMTVTAIKDVTPIPHNGCRAPKRRRV